MTIDEAMKVANFLTDLAIRIYGVARATPTGQDVDLDRLLVKPTTQKLKDAGIDPVKIDNLGKKDN